MSVMSDAREGVEDDIRRRKLYSAYSGYVLQAREKICKWIVDRIAERYKRDTKRTGVLVGLQAWLNEHNTLELTYSGVFAMSTRRRWVRRQTNLLFSDSMRLFEDTHSHKREAARLIESLLNAKHDDEEWVIRVKVKRVPDYMVEGKNFKGYDTLHFDFDRRTPDHS